MSVINCIRNEEGLSIFTDGAVYDHDGVVVGIISKILLLPHAPAAVSFRGMSSLLPKLSAIACRCLTFEALLTAVQVNAQMICVDSEVMLAGYSRTRGVFEIYLLPGHDNYASVGFPALVLTRMAHNCFLPGPNPEIAKQIGWDLPTMEAFDADRDGINLMECQRRDRQRYGYCVGGFIQRTDITRIGIKSRIVKWWPDEVGRHIEPDRCDLKKRGQLKYLETTSAIPYAATGQLWGIIAGVPDAMKAAVQAAKTGMQTPLPGELAQNIIPKQNKNIAFQQKPIGGVAGAIIGAPSRGASAIHSFFNFLGYRASIEAQAYRQAAKEGLKPTDDAFWQRRGAVADRPTPEMMNDAIEDGYKLTYISELGTVGKALSTFVKSSKVGQLIMPFTHIPLKILESAIQGTPAAFLDGDTCAALAGKSGAVKQDKAIARMVAGSAVGVWAVNMTLNDRLTGYGPTDQKERAQWLATGHQPYSVRIGDEWISFNRFGSLGTMLGLYSNLAEIIPHMEKDNSTLYQAIGMAVHTTGRLMEDEVGMQGLAGLMEAIEDPGRKGARYVSNFAGSLLPYSSFQRQTASAMDPYMRETKSVVDGLRYYVPGLRQGLNPKRDWLGAPIANAGYGGDLAVPGASSIIQHRDAVADSIAQEMATLDLHPAPPQARIKGVALPPKLYDTYQATAGPLLRQTLQSYINVPGWHDIPISARQDAFRSAIRISRGMAGSAMQMAHPELIQQGVADRLARINGVKPTKLQDTAAQP